MKKIFITVIFVAVALFFGSCGKNDVYKQRHTFENYSWERLNEGQNIVFNNINIKDTSSLYDIYVTVRHTPYINENNLKFLMKITTPDGITRESVHTIKLKDRFNENWSGKAMGDYIDLEEKCRSFVKFADKGDYSVTITNMGTYTKTVGIMDIGLKIVKADIDAYKNAE